MFFALLGSESRKLISFRYNKNEIEMAVVISNDCFIYMRLFSLIQESQLFFVSVIVGFVCVCRFE